MSAVAMVLVLLVVVIHIYIVVLEMFFWEARGPKVFRAFPRDLFAPTKAMAFNQGAYNGILVAGLCWSLVIPDDAWQRNVAAFFLLAVAAMGIAGALSVSKQILFVQTIPALLALAAVLI